VTFKNIATAGTPLRVELRGFDEAHAIEDVRFQNVTVNGKPLVRADIEANPFARNIRVEP
jgi:hypothetical protein